MRAFAMASLLATIAAQTAFTATRLRVEYLPEAITIDVPTPKFSYALSHPQRNQAQTSYHIVVQDAKGNVQVSSPTRRFALLYRCYLHILTPVYRVQWDSGVVQSNKTLNIVYAGNTLVSDSDYTWTVTWTDSSGAQAVPAVSAFSTAMLNPPTDFASAAWLSSTQISAGDGGLNTYRSTFTVGSSSSVSRARLYIAGMGYWKAWINGQAVDSHELGTFTTFERRVLYDVVDVSSLVQPGCNGLGIMLGHGWFAQPTVNSGPRQFMMILSVTTSDGTTTYYSSSLTGQVMASASLPGGRAGAATPLSFVATAGPVTADDIYIGETYDGRVAYALRGWATCVYKPASGVTWTPAVAPRTSVAQLGSILSSHPVQIVTDKDYTVVPGGPNQPGPGVFVYDFGQNMAGTVTLNVPDCPVGTVITLLHGEILYPNGSVHNHYLPGAPMTGVYICNGMDAMEVYRYMFTYMGFRYVQITGYPGVPGEEALTAHFIHSDMPQTGEFSSSHPLMNAIQHATRYASLSNLMDIPTDCPQRERRGWLGDAQLSFETVIHNFDGGAFYTKWIKDFVDTQVYDNLTMNAQGAMPDCIPFYGHGHTESDPGWGIAAWNIPSWFAEYYADDSFEAAYYPYLRWYMEHWIALAQNNTNQPGIFPIAWWGDWAEYYPGPYQHRTLDYADFFYVLGLQKTLQWATRLNIQADVQRYTTLLQAAQAQYLKIYYNATTHCYVDCMYASQIFGLTLGLQESGSAEEAAVWANAMSWFDANGANAKYPNHFGGGIIALKLVYQLLQKFGQQGLGLTWQLQDTIPSFGYWITQVGATTLLEAYDLTATNGGASYNVSIRRASFRHAPQPLPPSLNLTMCSMHAQQKPLCISSISCLVGVATGITTLWQALLASRALAAGLIW